MKSKQLSFCTLEVENELLELCFYAAYMHPEQLAPQRKKDLRLGMRLEAGPASELKSMSMCLCLL